ncbi:DUF1642 domain-containing protein [Lactococcus lactis]|uniref:DUF1642 domain-containing protein n=1 Tax=Lactococcus lactis TaxID=1358 RepID=UPI00207336F6|nr:DUF1642 domain-containing protein [Lactococcus lactis]
MTKFEEEVKRPANGPLTELNNNMQEVFSQYRKMRQYADYLEYELKQKDERIQDFKNALNEVSNELSRLSHENDSLKSQLQQQALPVVPECVAEWIEILKTKGLKPLKNPETYGETGFTEEKLQNIVFWISEHQEDYMRAWLDGYTVEKPQLFYLKHIDMSKSDAHLNWYLAKGTDNVLIHQGIKKGKSPKLKCILKLTQQEIDSMETGSYEQIEVVE